MRCARSSQASSPEHAARVLDDVQPAALLDGLLRNPGEGPVAGGIERPPRLDCPLFVRVAGHELAVTEVERRQQMGAGGIRFVPFEGLARTGESALDLPQIDVRQRCVDAVEALFDDDGASDVGRDRGDAATDLMDGDAEVVGAAFGTSVRPEQLDELIARHHTATLEGEVGEQETRFAAGPAGNRGLADAHLDGTEQAQRQLEGPRGNVKLRSGVGVCVRGRRDGPG